MPYKSPWHSNSPKEFRHHNNSACGPGSEIPEKNKVAGTGNFPLCVDCTKANRDGK